VANHLQGILANHVPAEEEHLAKRPVDHRDAPLRIKHQKAFVHRAHDPAEQIAVRAKLIHAARQNGSQPIQSPGQLSKLAGRGGMGAGVEVSGGELRHCRRKHSHIVGEAAGDIHRRGECHRQCQKSDDDQQATTLTVDLRRHEAVDRRSRAHRRQHQDRQELAVEFQRFGPELRSISRYPTPRIVSIKSPPGPNLWRSRLMCVSTVRVSISA